MVGITMVHGIHKKGLSPYRLTCKPNRAIKARYKIFRVFLGVLLVTSFVSSAPVRAIETTKASALVLEEMRVDSPLSFQKAPPRLAADPCLSLLHAFRLSSGGTASSQTRRPVGKTAVPVALGFFLGVRIALGPKEIIRSSTRVQIGPEIRATSVRGGQALAIAAYRSCKNNHVLGLQKRIRNEQAMK